MSRPDLHPPVITMQREDGRAGEGYFFGATNYQPTRDRTGATGENRYGPVIWNARGEPVWDGPRGPETVYTMDLKVQRYQGEPVLTYMEKNFVIRDQSYRKIAEVELADELENDLHEFLITPQDTALVLAAHEVRRDLTPVGGGAAQPVTENVIQEIDIPTGKVLMDWRSLDHAGLQEPFEPVPQDPEKPWDHFHANSIDFDGDGDLLVSARSTHSVLKIDRSSGAVEWRLGGKKSDFRMEPGALFRWQHDARRLPDGNISVFDNAVVPDVQNPRRQSRGLVLDVNERERTAKVVREDTSRAEFASGNQGSYQVLPNGHSVIGWGAEPFFSEFDGEGNEVVRGSFGEDTTSYRVRRQQWTGTPAEPPAVAARTDVLPGSTVVYASWNGATEVRGWRVLAGEAPGKLNPVHDEPKSGFETEMLLGSSPNYVSVQALDSAGKVIGTARPVKVTGE